jgi:hypothetical protein
MSARSLTISSSSWVRARYNFTARMAIASALLVAATASPVQSQMFCLRAASDVHLPENIVAGAVEEASRRFQIPAAWVRAVMRAESDGDANSVSAKGAIGLMQLMPKTYGELRTKLSLGSDPFDPRDNILAGAAYLAEMFDRYGATGFLAAYNAGPQRYEDYLFRGRPLPAETTDYVARLAPRLGLTNTSITQKDALANTHHRSIFVKSAALNLSDGAFSKRPAKPSDRRSQAAPHPLFSASSQSNIFAATPQIFGGPKASTGVARVQPNGIFFAHTSSKETP